MKAIILLSLVAGSLAATAGFLPINAQYVPVGNGACALQPGYVLYCLGANKPAASTAVTASKALCSITPNNLDVTMATGCQFNNGDDAMVYYYVFGCASGYNATGIGSNTQAVGFDATGAGKNTWDTTAASAITGFGGPVDFSKTTFACVPTPPPSCLYTCSGAGCASGASGNVSVGRTAQSLCQSGYFATVTAPASTTTTCPAGGLGNTTWVVTCSNEVTASTTTAQWFLIASGSPGWSEPKSCNCRTNPVCPKKNANSPTCSFCNLSPCVQTNAGQGTLGGVRQNQFAAAAFCPAGTITLAAMHDCFQQAACGGAIASGDICIYGVANQAGTAPCPTCPGGSKKGLLGLLGLLGLIPLLLCSSLLCLLLFCIRRNKKERDVHFATFDAGAPQVVAPVCHDFPVAHQTQTVHHATYVGPQHCAVPSGFGY